MSASQRRLGARELIDVVIDPGTYTSWDEPLDHSALSAEYQESLAAAAERSGCDESVITGQARIGGHDVALVVGVPMAVVSILMFSTTGGVYVLDTMDAFVNSFGIIAVAAVMMLGVT